MRIITTILIFFISLSSFSQTEEYIFKQFTDADGLSQSTIFAMMQDQLGYLWLGTIDGLNRYDGYEFKVYVNESEDSTSISDNFISALYEDDEGYIWVGTVNGYLNRFDRKTDVFKRYFINNYFSATKNPETKYYEYPLAFSRNQINTITSITEDRDGNLLIGTWGNGIIKFDKKKENAQHFFFEKDNPSSLSSNRVVDVLLDTDGEIWITTFGGGLNKLVQVENKNKRKDQPVKFLHYKNNKINKYSISDNKTITLFEDKDRNIWIGTFYGGLNKLDSINKKLPPNQVKFISYNRNNSNISNNTVMAVQQNFNGSLWVGTFGGGIDIMTINDERFKNFSEITSPQSDFPDDEILSLFVDRSGILWAGSHLGEGVTKIQKVKTKFNIINSKSTGKLKLNDDVVWSLFKDSKENLWVGTYRGGVNVLNFEIKKRKIFKKSIGKTGSIDDNHIRSIAEDKLGNIWIGTYSGGLNRINIHNSIVDTFVNEPGNSNSLSSNQVLDIFVESESKIWVATFGGGLNELLFKDNSSGRPKFKIYKHDESNKTSLSDDRVYTILKDKNNNFWVGTYGGGLNKFDEKTRKFEVVFPNPKNFQPAVNDKIMSINSSSDSTLWIGTSGGGLTKFNTKTNTSQNYSLAQGLVSAVVYGILEDENSNLWMSTDDGIFLFNTTTESFTQFGTEDGVQSLEFSGGAYFKDSSGIMYFGGINGFNYFHPDSIKINQYLPSVVISEVKVMDNRIKGEPTELRLSYDQNFISIEYAALDFSIPKQNQYSYILEGFQNSWMFTDGSSRKATYTNLPPGEFNFLVKGTNEDGIWNETPATLKIIINPPFWQTWWFVTLVILTVAFLIYFFGTIRVKSQLEIEKLKLKIASDLHDNIGAGLTEISILSEVAEQNDGDSSLVVKNELKKISNTARQLVDSMSDIVWVVNPQRDSLHDLIVRLKDSYNEFFSTIGISFQVNNIEKSDDIKLPMEYKQNLLLLFKEAINNAIKHSGCNKIALDAYYKNDLIEIKLKDDGNGFNLNEVKFGEGIKNMENRANKLKGNLKLSAESGKGTTVIFSGKIGRINKLKSLIN
jgi:ligand-binding sensor domain-containing protein/signal transduction histidine kinase